LSLRRWSPSTLSDTLEGDNGWKSSLKSRESCSDVGYCYYSAKLNLPDVVAKKILMGPWELTVLDGPFPPHPISLQLLTSPSPLGEAQWFPAFLPLCLFEPTAVTSCSSDQNGTGTVWVMFCGCEHM
jgi:hypothetical protein